MDPDQDCLWCCKPHCQERCPQCGLVAFCSPKHLANHLSQEGKCLPWRIRYAKGKGRFAEAVRDIQATELILKDQPLVVGPSRQQQIVCVECLQPVDGSVSCSDCALPLCKVECGQKGQWHRLIECPFLTKMGFKAASSKEGAAIDQATELPQLLVQLASITPLRLILRGMQGHASYQDLSSNDSLPLYDFFHDANENGGKIRSLEVDMMSTLWHKFGLRHHFSSEEAEDMVVRTAIGQLFNNAKSLEKPGHNGSGLYGRYCMLNHCCVSNTKCIINDANATFPLEVRAQTKIECGQEITTRYVGINMGSPMRSLVLKEHWSFTCTCKRCMDPTELGTFASAIRCTACGPSATGLMLPKGPVVPAMPSKWCCNTCDAELSQEQAEALIDCGHRIIKNNTSDPPEVKLLEHVIKELSTIFHSNHYLVMQVKFVLLQLLVSQTSQSSNAYDWARVTVVSFSLLSVLDKLDPGASRNRGKILKDLIKPFMKLAECEFLAGQIDEKAFEGRKAKAQQLAKDLITCYRFENVHQN